MNDIQVLIENIRKSIAFPESVTPDQMRDYARQYTEACTELSRRMMQCIQQIRAGNITEGIRLAELKPNLTEMYLSLDIPEREEWNEIVATLGFDVPPPFPVELSKEVSEAYMKLAPLEPLLRWHRLHALNGSSIKERLAMIRSIAKTDRENIYWSEDQEKFEKARIKELAKEIQQAIGTKNFQQIVSLHAELNTPDWIVQPPPDYRWKLASVVLQSEADSLMEKFSAFEHDEALGIYDRMQQIVTLEKMAMPPAIRQLIRPVVQWLNETKRQNTLQLEFNLAADELQNVLEEETELPELERLYYVLGTAASQAGMNIPDELEELYDAVIARRHTAARRKTQLFVVAIIAICLFAGGLLALGYWNHILIERGKIAIAELTNFKTELSTSKEPVKDLQARLDIKGKSVTNISLKNRDRSVVNNILEEIKILIDNMVRNEKEFRQYHDQAKDAISPPEPDLSLTTKFLVEQAKKRFRTQEEKTTFEKLQSEYRLLLDGEFDNILSGISTDHNAVNTNPNLSPRNKIERFKQLEESCKNLLNKYDDASEQRKNQCRNRMNAITRDRMDIEGGESLIITMDELFSAVPDWAAYQSVLQRLADFTGNDMLPNHSIATDAGDMLNEIGAVKETAESLRDFAVSYTKVAGDFRTLQQASASLKKKNDVISTRLSGTLNDIFQQGDIFETLSKMIPYSPGTFTAVERRLGELSQAEHFPWIGDNTSRWYYLTERPTKAGKYNYVTEPFGGNETDYSINSAQFSRANVPSPTPYAFARETQKRIDEITDNVETVVDATVRRLIREDSEPGIDPIIQCQMMDSLIQDMSRIDPFFAKNFEEPHRIIQRSGVDSLTTWMTVDTRTDRQRANASNAIDSCRQNIHQAVDNTLQDREEFIEKVMQFQPRFEWVGLLTKNDGKWNCAVKPGTISVESGDLYILRQKANQTVEPVRIGQVSSRKVELRSNEPLFLQCAPVFLVQH